MKTWDEYLIRMAPHVPGCPEFEVMNRVRDAAIEFCDRSRVWKVRHVTLGTSVALQADYRVTDNPVHAGLCHIHAAWIGRDEIGVVVPGEGEEDHPGQFREARQLAVELAGRALFRLLPSPQQSGLVVVATVSYCPTDTADGVPEFVDRDWGEAIEKRALCELMLQPGKPWTNTSMAEVHMARFERLLREAQEKAGPVRRPGRGLRVRQWG